MTCRAFIVAATLMAAPPVLADEPVTDDASAGRAAVVDWLSFRLEGVHPFVGVTVLGGPMVGVSPPSTSVGGAFLFGLKAGVFLNRVELALEVSPLSYVWVGSSILPNFQVNGTIGYAIPLYAGDAVEVYWPLRVGAGMFMAPSFGGASFQARADLVGVMIRLGHLTIDVHLPSFRYGLLSPSHLLTFGCGVGVGYAF
jgi:hypothetical protein